MCRVMFLFKYFNCTISTHDFKRMCDILTQADYKCFRPEIISMALLLRFHLGWTRFRHTLQFHPGLLSDNRIHLDDVFMVLSKYEPVFNDSVS